MPNFKISFNKFFLFSYVVMAATALVLVTLVTVFLYKNFYQTITSSQELIILKKQVMTEDIDISKFDLIIKKFEEKVKFRKSDINLNF